MFKNSEKVSAFAVYENGKSKKANTKVVNKLLNNKNNQIKKENKIKYSVLRKKGDPCNISITFSNNPYIKACDLLKWMLSPIKIDNLLSNYWEKGILHVNRYRPNYFKKLFSSKILDSMIRENKLYYTKNVDIVSYINGQKEIYNLEGQAVPVTLWDYYLNGCSIRILNPQSYNHKLHMVISRLQEYFGSMVGCNVYLTPPNSQGFAPHFDDIEAFILQIEGRKHWTLYKPKDKDILARTSSGNFNRNDLGEVLMEVTLEPGDLLYFPRGTVHEAKTDEEYHSLHITISVYQKNAYVDLLEHILPQALKKASEENIEFRRGLPLNFLKSFGKGNVDYSCPQRDVIESTVKSLIKSLVDYIDIDAGADQLGRIFIRDSMPPVFTKEEKKRSSKRRFNSLIEGKVVKRDCLNIDTQIRLLRYFCIRLVYDENGTPLLYYNLDNANSYHGAEEQWLELEHSMTDAIKYLLNVFPIYVKIRNLPVPNNDDKIKLQLINVLWERGIVITNSII